jgi:hypothetical protein
MPLCELPASIFPGPAVWNLWIEIRWEAFEVLFYFRKFIPITICHLRKSFILVAHFKNFDRDTSMNRCIKIEISNIHTYFLFYI